MVAVTLVDLVQVETASVGVGPLLLGDAVSGYRGVEALTDDTTYAYSIRQADDYEYGTGIYTAATATLTREVAHSSNDDDDPIIVRAGSSVEFVVRAQDIASGSGVLGPNLVALNAQNTAPDELSYWTGDGTAALTALTAFMRTVLSADSDSTARALLGLGTMATQAASAYAALAGADFAGQTTFTVSGQPRGQFDDSGLTLGTKYAFQSGGVTIVSRKNSQIADGSVYHALDTMFGNHSKGNSYYFYKSRGATVGDTGTLLTGDAVLSFQIDGDTGNTALPAGTPGHVGRIDLRVDGIPAGGYPEHEMYGRWNFQTCGGPTGPTSAGIRTALALNREQKVLVTGPLTTAPSAGTIFGAVFTIGAGQSTATNGQLLLTPGTKLATPEPNIIENDGTNILLTNAAGSRGRILVGNETTAAFAAPGAINRKAYTVGTLPVSPTVGDAYRVTDANAPSWGSTVASGGTARVPVYWNGSNWIVG